MSDHRHQLRKAFHGPVLHDIAMQAWVPQPDGTRSRYAPAAWKLFFAQLFAVPVFEKRGQAVAVRHSTEQLTDNQYQIFLLEVQSFAAMELGVEFSDVQQTPHTAQRPRSHGRTTGEATHGNRQENQ